MHTLGLAALLALLSFGANAAPSVQYVIPVGLEDYAEDEIDGVSVAPDGQACITGVARGGIRLGDIYYPSRGQGDVFLACYEEDGAILWSHIYGSSGDDNAFDMDNDDAGNLYLSGWFSGNVNFGGYQLTSRGNTDMFVVKVAPDGTTLWVKSFGGPAADGGNEIAVRPDGSFVVSGTSDGSFTVEDTTYPNQPSLDTYAIRMDADGNVRWVETFAGPGNERIRAIAMGPAGEVCVGFTFKNSLTYDGGVIAALGDWDGALTCIDPFGALQWARHVGSAIGEDNVRGLGIAPDGTVYASGAITGRGILFNQSFPPELTSGGDYIAFFKANGEFGGIITLVGTGAPSGSEMTESDVAIYISGTTVGRTILRMSGVPLLTFGPSTSRRIGYLIEIPYFEAISGALETRPLQTGAVGRANSMDALADGSRIANVWRFQYDNQLGPFLLDGTYQAESALALSVP